MEKPEVTALVALRKDLKGEAYSPGDDGYDEARTAWYLNARQSPALVVAAEHHRELVL